MIKWYEHKRGPKKRKIIEVIQGYSAVGETGHIFSGVKFGLLTWDMPIIYKENPNFSKSH
jgi:hypothetical protein